MEWRYNQMRQVHELAQGDTVLARIFVSEKTKQARPFRARTLVSGLYYGATRLARLDRRRKEWVSMQKKFRTREDLETYIGRKKADVERFIRAREAEA